MVAKQLMRSRNPRERLAGRQLSRARVVQGSALDLAIRVSAAVMKEAAAAGGAGPATGAPITGQDVSTPTADGRFRRRRPAKYDVANG